MHVKKFGELEFHAIIKQLNNLGEQRSLEKYIDKKDYSIVLTTKHLNEMVEVLKKSDLIAFDVITTNMTPIDAEIVGLSFSVNEKNAYYVPIRYPEKDNNNFGDNDEKFLMSVLKEILEDSQKLKTGHNIKFCSLVLKKYGVNVKGYILIH